MDIVRVMNVQMRVLRTFMTLLLVHKHQKEKIALEMAAIIIKIFLTLIIIKIFSRYFVNQTLILA
jgi:TRAP-type C4-dicarboxylate transport system permease small subunit